MLILRNLTTSHTFNIQLVDTRTIISTETIITELRESIKQLSAENKEKHVALRDASSELKELKEVVESVSTKNYVFVILYYSSYTVFALDSSFNSCLIRQSFTFIFSTTRFILFKSCSIRQSPLFSSPPFSSTTRFIPFPLHRAPIPLFLGLFPPPPPRALLLPLSYSLLYSLSPGKKELQRIHVTNGV